MCGVWTLGAPHASEIPFVSDTLRAHHGSAFTPADEAMSRTLQRHWVAFARTGGGRTGAARRLGRAIGPAPAG